MSKHESVDVSFSNRTIIRVVLVVALSVIAIQFLQRIAHPLTLIFVSCFLAIALNPAVSWISNKLKTKSRVLATGIAYIIVVTILCSFIWLVVPPTVKQSIDFINDVPTNLQEVRQNDTATSRFINRYNLTPAIESAAKKVQENVDDVGKQAVNTVGRVGGIIVSVLTVFVLTFMMLVEAPSWIKKVWGMQDPRHVPKRKRAAERMYRVITGYVNGQLFLALIAGLFAFIALTIASSLLGFTINAVVYASIVTLFGLIPMFGNTIAAIIVVLLCALTSVPLALIMLVFFIVYQQVENVTLQPYIQSKSNELTPLLVFVAAIVGVGFGGFLGALIAIPMAGCIKVFVTEFYGDRLRFNPDAKSQKVEI